MGTAAIQALIAGLGGGAASLGASLDARDQAADAEKMKQAAADRALKQLLAVEAKRNQDALALEATKEAGSGEWEKAEPFTLPDNTTVMAERSRRTGQYRPVNITGQGQTSVPRAPTAPVGMEDVGDSQDMTGAGGSDAAMSALTGAPPTQGGPARPYVKPAAVTPPRTLATTKGIMQWDATEHAWKPTGMLPPNVAMDDYMNRPQRVQVADGNGGVKWAWLKPGEDAPVAPKAGSAGSSMSLSPEDRQKMVAQAQLDNATMKRIEQRVLDGDLTFGTGAGVAGALSAAHGGVVNDVVGVLGNAAAGAIDPDIQQYFTAQQSYGRIMGNLQSKRYTDHQADIERRISGMQGNDLKNTINYKQSLRDKSLDDVKAPNAGGAPKAAPKKKAATDPVLDKYGLTPKPDDED